MPNAEGRMEEATRVVVGAVHYVHDGNGWLRTSADGMLAGYVLNTELLALLDALAARTREVEAMRVENERLRWELRNAAHTCERWADESRNGGWSTHQVDANRAVANRIYRALAAQEGTR